MIGILGKMLSLPTSPTCLSLLSEIWDAIKGAFTIEFGDYENININNGGLIKPGTLIVGFIVGMILAAIGATFSKTVIGSFVRRLISEGCLTPESAKTIAELGFERNSAVRGALRSNRVLRKYVRIVVEDDKEDSNEAEEAAEQTLPEEQYGLFPKKAPRKKPGRRLCEVGGVDLSTARLFIDVDDKYSAETRFDKKGSSFLSLAIVIVVIIVFTILVIEFIPDILAYLDTFFESDGGPGGYLDR